MSTVELKSLAKERSAKEMLADCKRAFERAQPYHNELQSIYRHMMPWRQATMERAPGAGGSGEGLSITDYIFDGTGLSAAANYPGQMMADWMPLFQEFFKLEAGPFLPDGLDQKQFNETLANVTARVHAVSGAAQTAVLESFYDHFAGTSALFVERGDSDTIVEAQAVPTIELAFENGPRGTPWHHYWRRNYLLRDLPALWPNGRVSKALGKSIQDSPASPCQVVQYTYFDKPSRRWRLAVWTDRDGEDDALLWEQEFRTSPWMTPRMFVVPGEPFGRGLAHLALPFQKTANRGRELALKAAVFAILGIWMTRNDGVFNPETAVFDPGAMWAVGSTGGVLGPAISRLPVPQDFDITSIVQEQERAEIRRVLLDDELPSEQDPVRSATEVAGRLRRFQRNRGGTGIRLAFELVTPFVQRVCEILEDARMIPTRITIDQIVTKCLLTAPAAAAQRSDKVERAVNWIQMIVMLFGPEAAALVVKMEELLPEIGRWMGNDERFIRGKEELKELKDMIAQLVAAQQMSASTKGRNGAQAPPPGQPYVNGGAM